MRCSRTCKLQGQEWHYCMGKSRLWHNTGDFSPFYLCRSVAVQGSVAYLVSALDSNDKQPFSCLGLPCVTSCKSPQTTRRKPQRQFVSVEAKLLGITPRLHYNHSLSACGCESGTKNVCVHTIPCQYVWQNFSTRSSLAGMIRIRVWRCQRCFILLGHTDPAVKLKHLLQLISA